MDFCSLMMVKKSSVSKNNLSVAKKKISGGKTVASLKPGKTGATGILKKTDTTERPVRTGKTGATGIIRETGKNGMEDLSTVALNMQLKVKALSTKGSSAKGGRKRVPVILVTNDDGIS